MGGEAMMMTTLIGEAAQTNDTTISHEIGQGGSGRGSDNNEDNGCHGASANNGLQHDGCG
jgi:hypothetical protein